MAAIGGCAAFGTISGSSLATAAMMGQVSLPELHRYRYASGFATGALAAGGTLGILIPPSIPLIIYAIMVEGNIVQLFQGAFVPGSATSPSSSLWYGSTRRPGRLADGRPRRSGGRRWATFGR